MNGWTAKDYLELITGVLVALGGLVTAVGGVVLKILQEQRDHEQRANRRAALRGDPALPERKP